MVKRIITALLIIACVIPPLLYGGILNYILVAGVIIVGGFELFSLLPSYKWVSKLIFLIPLGICYLLLFFEEKVSVVLLGVLILSLLAIPIFTTRFNSRDAIMSGGILVLLYLCGNAYLSIYEVDRLYIFFVAIATYATDTGAYFTGYFFGKNKLCERISPKKTIEGSIGGIIFSIVLSVLFVFFFFKEANLLLVILGGLLIPVVSQIGDLSFSAIKRLYDIKDFSNLFPGHGGVMDRLDSLLFDLILFYALMVVIL